MAEFEDCVTMTQFNEMKQSMEELKANVQALMNRIQDHPRNDANASQHRDDVEEIEKEVAARIAIEQQRGQRNNVAANARRPPLQSRGNDGRGADCGRDHRLEETETEEDDEEEEVQQPYHDDRRHRDNHGRSRPNEEMFGKLKFTMPKFEGGSNPETYLT